MNLNGQPGELKFTLQIKRAATGQTETVELIGRINDGGNSQHSSTERGDGCSNGAHLDIGEAKVSA